MAFGQGPPLRLSETRGLIIEDEHVVSRRKELWINQLHPVYKPFNAQFRTAFAPHFPLNYFSSRDD